MKKKPLRMVEPIPAEPPPYTPKHSPISVEGTNIRFLGGCEEAYHLFAAKNKEYDGAFQKYGLLGVVFEILGVLNRLPPMTIWLKRDEPLNVAKLKDLFLDLHNFSMMALMLLEDNNLDGRNPIHEETDDE